MMSSGPPLICARTYNAKPLLLLDSLFQRQLMLRISCLCLFQGTFKIQSSYRKSRPNTDPKFKFFGGSCDDVIGI